MTEYPYKTSLLMLSCDESQMVNPNLISFEHSEDFVLLYTQGSNEFTPFGYVGVIQPFTPQVWVQIPLKLKTSIVKLTPLFNLKHGT